MNDQHATAIATVTATNGRLKHLEVIQLFQALKKIEKITGEHSAKTLYRLAANLQKLSRIGQAIDVVAAALNQQEGGQARWTEFLGKPCEEEIHLAPVDFASINAAENRITPTELALLMNAGLLENLPE